MLKHLVLALTLGSAISIGVAVASTEHHVNATLQPVGGSGVSGKVELTAMPKGGTLITVVAKGLQPGTEYLSLYYDNGTCELEPYSADDVIVPGVIEVRDGAVKVPTGPGLGVELDTDALDRAHRRYLDSGIRDRDDTGYMRRIRPEYERRLPRW